MEVVKRKEDRPPVLVILLILAAAAALAACIYLYSTSDSVKISRALKSAEQECAAGDYEQGADDALEALSLDRTNAKAYSILVDCYAGEENYDAMTAAYSDAKERLSEEDEKTLRNKVLTYLDNAAAKAETAGDTDAAVLYYKEVIEIASSGSQLAVEAREKIDDLTKEDEEREDPAAEYEAALEENPDDEEALRGLADVREQEGDTEAARAALKKLISLNPEDEDLVLEYTTVCLSVGDYDDALEVLESAYERTKSQTLYAKIVSVTAAKAGDASGEEAVTLWQSVLRMNPDYVEAYASLSDVYYDLGEYEKAVHILETGYEQTNDTLLKKQLSTLNKSLAQEGITIDDDDVENPVKELAGYLSENRYADALKLMAKKEFQDKVRERKDEADEDGRLILTEEDFAEETAEKQAEEESEESSTGESEEASAEDQENSASTEESSGEDTGDEEPASVKIVVNEDEEQFFANSEDGTTITCYWPAVTDSAGRVVIGEYGEDAYGNANYVLSDGTVLTAYEYLIEYAP